MKKLHVINDLSDFNLAVGEMESDSSWPTPDICVPKGGICWPTPD